MFQSIMLRNGGSETVASIENIRDEQLPNGNVTVRIGHSCLNYKDALAITGRGSVVRAFPMVPGIDFAGTVEQSTDSRFTAGEMVLLNGFGVGEVHWGGLAGKARVDADWLIHLPPVMSDRQAMQIGTAGYTAMLCVMALERAGVTPNKGEVVVTGASGGVGGIATLLLSKLGYRVVAITGRPQEADYLHALGAKTILSRGEFEKPGKPLQKQRWAGAIDSLGGPALANVCAGMVEDGVVTACGLAQSIDFPATVAPFIFRGVHLIGINSVYRNLADRIVAWRRLADTIDFGALEAMTTTIPLTEVCATASDIVDGKIRGRIVVDVDA